MSQDLSYLQYLDAESFEAERSRLIGAELLKVAPERRKKLLLLQLELDQFRSTHTSEEFMRELVLRLNEQVENLEDIAQYLKNTQVKKT
jgi:hypothetical protein